MIPIADHMRTVFKDTDRGFDQYLAKVQADYGYIKSCKRGCAACCELFNLITWPEAAIIAEQLRADGRLRPPRFPCCCCASAAAAWP